MNMKTMVIAIGILLGFCAGIHFYVEWQKREFDASLPQPPAPVQTRAAETTGGHWHGDEWHAEPHNANFVTPFADPPEVDFSVKPTASETLSERPLTFDDIDISDKMAEILALYDVHNPEWSAWKRKHLVHRAEEQRLQEEWHALIPPGLDTVEKAEAFIKRTDSLSDEEKLAFVEKLEALVQKGEALHEQWKALMAEQPDMGGQN